MIVVFFMILVLVTQVGLVGYLLTKQADERHAEVMEALDRLEALGKGGSQ